MTKVVPAPLSKADAQRAIYIDFEGLGTDDAEPSLLGVLIANTAGAVFTQYLWDPLLASARVARKAARTVSSLDEAIEAVVSMAERESRLVVSWSRHEVEMVRRFCAAPLSARLDASHLNALDVVKPWKKDLYPSFEFNLEQFGGKHPLKEYFRMTGYPLPKELQPPEPARWLRHVLERLQKASGRYRDVTPKTKRDWHKLLVYNEHDCRGMFEVVAQAVREHTLWNAYALTHFVVVDGAREVGLRVGSRNAELDVLVTSLGASRWALVTASNPDYVALSAVENQQRHTMLRVKLESAGYSLLPAEGRDPTDTWPTESSFFVPDMTSREARALGRTFGQLVILKGHPGTKAMLVPCGLEPDRHRTRLVTSA